MFKGFYLKTTSLFNGAPIVVVFTGFSKRSANIKTGAMIQCWILDSRSNPFAISKARKDFSICGDCPQRHSKKGKCYVNLMHGPHAVYKAFKRNNYTELDLTNPKHLQMFNDKLVRFGTYGDPAAIDINIWNQIILNGKPKGFTSYTHAWKQNKFQALKSFSMASCDTEEEAILAQTMGWRTFRSRTNKESLLKTEYMCPASKEAGKKLTCETCLSCNGAKQPTTPKSVAIILHGTWTKKTERFVA